MLPVEHGFLTTISGMDPLVKWVGNTSCNPELPELVAFCVIMVSGNKKTKMSDSVVTEEYFKSSSAGSSHGQSTIKHIVHNKNNSDSA
jgi:hypothetical protein